MSSEGKSKKANPGEHSANPNSVAKNGTAHEVADTFPRTMKWASVSPTFFAVNKDRYLR